MGRRMNLLAAAALAGLATGCWGIRRSFLYPPTVFAVVWAAALCWLWLAGDAYWTISDATRLIYVSGAFSFAAGGLVASLVWERWTAAATVARTAVSTIRERLLDGGLALLIGGLPFYMRSLGGWGDGSLATLLFNVRRKQVIEGALGLRAGLLDNFVPFSLILAVIAFSQVPAGRWSRVRAIAIGTVALLYQALTGGRAGITALVLAVGAAIWMRKGRLPIAGMTILGILFLLLFGAIAVAVQKGTAHPDAPLSHNVAAVLGGLEWYAVGGVVAFDRMVEDPHLIPSQGAALRGVLLILNRLGAQFDVPVLYAQYTTVGDFKDINVYTLYGWYVPDYGVATAMLLLVTAGVLITLVYEAARRGSLLYRVLYALLFASIVVSLFVESFYNNINLLAKAALTTALLTYASRRLGRGSSRAVGPQH